MTRVSLSAMPIDQWPKLDRELWNTAKRRDDLFEDGGLASDWRPDTVKNCERNYGVYLTWLVSTGQLEPVAHPCERINEDHIRAFITTYCVGRAELTVAGTVRDIAYVLRGCRPPNGVVWLTKFAHRLMASARPARPKLPRMARISELLHLSQRLMELGLKRVQGGRVSGAPLYRDGLIIALLCHRPLRRRNLAALRLGDSMLIDERGTRICLRRDETKKRIAMDCTVPTSFLPALGTYLRVIRPVLLKRRDTADEGWLWISRRGGKLSEIDISVRISKLTYRYLGRRISPHLFRDCVATEIALEDPAHIGITKDMLGHANISSGQKFYNQATSLTANARHQDVIRKIRGDG